MLANNNNNNNNDNDNNNNGWLLYSADLFIEQKLNALGNALGKHA